MIVLTLERRTSVTVVAGWLLAAAALVASAPSHAQATYDSVFSGYTSFREKAAPIDWRTANREAGDLGGFVGQMRASPRGPETAAESSAGAGPKERMSGMREMMEAHHAARRSSGAMPMSSKPMQGEEAAK